MSTKNIIKPVSKTVSISNVQELVKRVFGSAATPADQAQTEAALNELSLDEKVQLYASLNIYRNSFDNHCKALAKAILDETPADVQHDCGTADPYIEVKNAAGNVVGHVSIDTEVCDELNTVTSSATAKKVKAAIVAENLGPAYIKTVERLDHSALAASFASKTLPTSVLTLLSVNHKKERTVRFSPEVK